MAMLGAPDPLGRWGVFAFVAAGSVDDARAEGNDVHVVGPDLFLQVSGETLEPMFSTNISSEVTVLELADNRRDHGVAAADAQSERGSRGSTSVLGKRLVPVTSTSVPGGSDRWDHNAPNRTSNRGGQAQRVRPVYRESCFVAQTRSRGAQSGILGQCGVCVLERRDWSKRSVSSAGSDPTGRVPLCAWQKCCRSPRRPDCSFQFAGRRNANGCVTGIRRRVQEG